MSWAPHHAAGGLPDGFPGNGRYIDDFWLRSAPRREIIGRKADVSLLALDLTKYRDELLLWLEWQNTALANCSSCTAARPNDRP